MDPYLLVATPRRRGKPAPPSPCVSLIERKSRTFEAMILPRFPTARAAPTGQRLIAGLRILVTMAVDVLDAGVPALALEALQVLDVSHRGRYETAPAGQHFGFIQ